MPLPGSFKKVFKKKDISDPSILKYKDQDYNKVSQYSAKFIVNCIERSIIHGPEMLIICSKIPVQLN